MSLGGGDQLARGASRAQFSGPEVSDEKWKEMFGDDGSFEERMKKRAIAEGLSEEQYEQAKAEAARQAQEIEEQRKKEQEAAQATIKIRAIQDRIVVRRIEQEEKVGSFYVPDESKEKPAEGVVVAVGPGRFVDGHLQPVSVAVGEIVVFGKYSGAEVKIGFEKLLVLREEDLFLVRS